MDVPAALRSLPSFRGQCEPRRMCIPASDLVLGALATREAHPSWFASKYVEMRCRILGSNHLDQYVICTNMFSVFIAEMAVQRLPSSGAVRLEGS